MRTRRRLGRLALIYGGVCMLLVALVALERAGPSPVGSIAEPTIEIGDPIGGQRDSGHASGPKFCERHDDDHGDDAHGDDEARCAHAPMSGSIGGDCPWGHTLIAKFNWDGRKYVFEKPWGNKSKVTVTGNATRGTWGSTVLTSAVVLKGSTDLKVVTYSPTAIRGSFDNSGLLTPSGRTAALSNIRFCDD